MDAGSIERIESGAERGASALFAAAVGYAAYRLAATAGVDPRLGLSAAGVGVLAYLPCIGLLGAAGARGTTFALPDFAVRDFEFAEAPDELLLTVRVSTGDELVLTDAERLDSDVPLDLDDILAEIGPDSRVVRLFDRKAMPAQLTPGQLQSRIANHLEDGASQFAPPDASQALSAALAELRRSLR